MSVINPYKVGFFVSPIVGYAPLVVNLQGYSELSADAWTWDFGDGDSAFIQSPAHTYDARGWYDVTVEIQVGGDSYTRLKPKCVAVLADTVRSDSAEGRLGDIVVLTVDVNNVVPLHGINIPVEYAGDFDVALDSFVTTGCRTEYFVDQRFIHYDPSNKRATIRLTSSASHSLPDLPPGDGPVLKLYFKLLAASEYDLTVPVAFDGYVTTTPYTPYFVSELMTYEPATRPGLIVVRCCGHRGNVDGLPGPGGYVDVSDLTYLVTYLFQSGPEPPCIEEGNVDGIVGVGGPIDVADLTYLVAYLFQAGPEPPPCP